MNHKRITTSLVLATLMLVSLFAVVSSAASVSGTVMAGTGPAATSSGGIQAPAGYSGYADFFAVDTNGTLWHTPMNGNNSWDSLGGVSTSSPAAVSCSTNSFRLHVFVRGTDGALWHKYYQNGWSKWESLGGRLASGTGPAVSSSSAGKLDVFVQGTDGALWHTSYNNSWSKWESLGGKLTSSPAVIGNWVFVRGTDGAAWWWWKGSSAWKSLGGKVASSTGPAVSESGWLIVQGTDHQFWQYFVGLYRAHWESLGVAPPEALSASSPGAVSVPANEHTLVVFSSTMVVFSSTSGNVWYGIHDVTGLISRWTSAGSPP